MKFSARVFIAPLLLSTLGCGSTRIVSQDPTAEIFLNDQLLGVGAASVDRVGPPRRAVLEARKGGKIVGTQEMRRSFRFMTLVWGLCSYYTGFYWGWYFPDYVSIPVRITVSNTEVEKNSWQDPRQSIWMLPLK